MHVQIQASYWISRLAPDLNTTVPWQMEEKRGETNRIQRKAQNKELSDVQRLVEYRGDATYSLRISAFGRVRKQRKGRNMGKGANEQCCYFILLLVAR